jgi:hypothetical protein
MHFRDSILALQPRMLSLLSRGVWHCTHPDRHASILATGAILPEPDIGDALRWKTGAGPDYYPYARHLGGVSLFQFEGFDVEAYERDYPMSSWRTFVPCVEDWPATVWIEIDRSRLSGFISGADLIQRWRDEAAYRHTIMPLIEAAHIGPLPRAAFGRTLIVCPADESIVEREVAAAAHG